jgi:hypothetical protein
MVGDQPFFIPALLTAGDKPDKRLFLFRFQHGD